MSTAGQHEILRLVDGELVGADQTYMPFGGYKDGGIGRQNGVAGFDQYVELKAVAWPA